LQPLFNPITGVMLRDAELMEQKSFGIYSEALNT